MNKIGISPYQIGDVLYDIFGDTLTVQKIVMIYEKDKRDEEYALCFNEKRIPVKVYFSDFEKNVFFSEEKAKQAMQYEDMELQRGDLEL